MKEASSKFSLRDVIKKCGKPASGVYKMDGCGSITQGKVEGFCEVYLVKITFYLQKGMRCME